MTRPHELTDRTTSRRWPAVTVAAALALGLVGCGTTVPLQTQASSVTGAPGAGSDGLGAGTVLEPTGDAPVVDGVVGGADVPVAPVTTATAPGCRPPAVTSPGGTSSSAGPTGQTSSAAPVTTASGPRLTTPVKVGFVNTKVGNAEGAGLDVGQTASPEQVFRALVASVNAQGGLAGRRVVPVVADSDTASGNWGSDFAAACERFTRDEKVSVVLGYVFVQLDSFDSCLAKAGVPHLSGSYNIGDEKTLADNPLLVGTNALTSDRRFRLQLEGAVRDGTLTRSNKLGLILDGCASTVRAVARTVDPYIKAAGLDEAARVTFSCPSGAGDAGAAISQVQGAVLRFRQEGVDRVFVEGVPLVLFAQSAESQGYRPTYLVTSTSPGAGLEANMPRPQLENVRGYGWMPHMDVGASGRPAATAVQTRCLSLLKAGGFVPREYNDFLNAYTSCDGLFAYEAALKRTNGRTDAREVVAALTGLRGSLPGVGLYGGRSDYGRRNAPTVYRSWRLAAACGCFRLSSGEQPLS